MEGGTVLFIENIQPTIIFRLPLHEFHTQYNPNCIIKPGHLLPLSLGEHALPKNMDGIYMVDKMEQGSFNNYPGPEGKHLIHLFGTDCFFLTIFFAGRRKRNDEPLLHPELFWLTQ